MIIISNSSPLILSAIPLFCFFHFMLPPNIVCFLSMYLL
ncbi:hypothetical protein [Enterococcus phage vB_Efs25_KEN11]|uniref:Uncharacterized protein n=1 Tax=Enterococcus phage vB_Efs6_KEN16 TaxID=3138325 RepID=A0AAX4PUP5_9CAUD